MPTPPHHDIAATVAISLGDVPACRVDNLLVLYGQFELPLFARTARQTLASSRWPCCCSPSLWRYSTAMIAVPVHIGLTWPLGRGRWYLHAVVLAVALLPLATLTVTGIGSGFLMLVLALVVALLGIGAGVAAVMRRLAVSPWLAAAVAAPVFAWPSATTLPLA